jgi:hypothetical protein
MPVTIDLTKNVLWQAAYARGFELGLEEARRETRARHRADACRWALNRLLPQRFGELAPCVRKRIDDGSSEELEL